MEFVFDFFLISFSQWFAFVFWWIKRGRQGAPSRWRGRARGAAVEQAWLTWWRRHGFVMFHFIGNLGRLLYVLFVELFSSLIDEPRYLYLYIWNLTLLLFVLSVLFKYMSLGLSLDIYFDSDLLFCNKYLMLVKLSLGSN